MAVKLYLHIGHLYGSSGHIEALLCANRDVLKARGYGVCDSQLLLSGKPGSSAFFSPYLDSDPSSPSLSAVFRNLRALADAQGLQAVVLSAPNLAVPGGAKFVAALRDYFDCKLLYYFKRQDDLVVDWWMQGDFKTGEGLNAYINRLVTTHPRCHYRNALEEYLDLFGHDRMRVQFLWHKVLKGKTLAQDFWHALGLDAEGFIDAPEPAPLVSSYLGAALKESPYLFEGSDDEELIDFIRSYVEGDPVHKVNPLDVEPRRAIMQHFQPENRWLKETFFADVKMPGWNAVTDTDDRLYDVSPAGMTEIINIQLAMLKELQQDVSRIKKRMGLK
ncbi:hypothetical protein [Kordiimonas sp.]|uniref:hypothetical protein n=1 Tax=Kordiimonas sp. TaxID=1970157 RepID=UPI003A8F3F89